MKLGHIGLTVFDLNRSEHFYSDLFGFKTFFRIRRKDTPWLAAQVGYPEVDIEFCHMRGLDGVHLELLKYWSHLDAYPCPDDTFRPGNVHINIWVENAHETACRVIDWMAANDKGKTRFAPKPLDIEASTITDGPQTGGKGFYMRDPDGHTIEIWQPAPGNGFGKTLSPELESIISNIQAARAKNNDNWCELIRVLYRVAPDEAKKIFRKIEAQDAEILKLAQSSANAV